MMDLDNIEKGVLEKLIFEERFENILAECRHLALPNVINDALKYLIQHKLVVAKILSENKKSKAGYMYDSDKMKDYTYQATAKGLKHL
jgi:hypothetical protein